MQSNVNQMVLSAMTTDEVLEKLQHKEVLFHTALHFELINELIFKMYKNQDFRCLEMLMKGAVNLLDFRAVAYICSKIADEYLIQYFDCIKKLIDVNDVRTKYRGICLHSFFAHEIEDLEKLIMCIYGSEEFTRRMTLDAFLKLDDKRLDVIISNSNKNPIFCYFEILKKSKLNTLSKEFFLENIKHSDAVCKKIVFIAAIKKELDIKFLKELVHLSRDADLFSYFYFYKINFPKFKKEFYEVFERDITDFI